MEKTDVLMKAKLKSDELRLELKDGTIVTISDEALEKISDAAILNMMINCNSNIYIRRDSAIEKCNLLYKIIAEQKDKMTDDVRKNYLKTINTLISGNEQEDISYKDFKKDNSNR